jgi:hypothetical protein
MFVGIFTAIFLDIIVFSPPWCDQDVDIRQDNGTGRRGGNVPG